MNAEDRKRVNALMIRLADGDRSVFDEVFAALWAEGETMTLDEVIEYAVKT